MLGSQIVQTAVAAGNVVGDRQLQPAPGLLLLEWPGSLMQRFYGRQTQHNLMSCCYQMPSTFEFML
jgi:hypothetical protein